MGRTVKWSIKTSMCFLFGLISCVILTVMYLAQSINIECFYDVGDIYNVRKLAYAYAGNNWLCDSTTEEINITEDIANKMFAVEVQKKHWNYLYLDLENLPKETVWEVQVLNQAFEAAGTIQQEMRNGINILELPEQEVYGINFVVSGEKGLTFSLKKIQFRERIKMFGLEEFFPAFAVISFLFLLGCFFVRGIWRKRRISRGTRAGQWIGDAQKFYAYLLAKGSKVQDLFTPYLIPKARACLFFLCFLLIYLMVAYRWRWKFAAQNQMVLLIGICILLIGFLSWEGKKPFAYWKNPLVAAWFALWLFCMVSEFFVEKTFRNIGIFMLLSVTPFYFSWNQMENPTELIRDLKRALGCFYWASCIFCIVCRPLTAGVRYMGSFNNPNTFAGFLATANLVFLDNLGQGFQKFPNGQKKKKLQLINGTAGVASIFFFLQLTQSVTGIAVFVLECMIFLLRLFLNRKQGGHGKCLLKLVGAALLSSVLIFTLGRWCLVNVANLLHTVVHLPGDFYQIAGNKGFFTFAAYAANDELPVLNRIVQKLSGNNYTVLLSGRDVVWDVYVRQLNLLGHEKWMEIWEGRMHAHNNLLQMMYDYGVFVALPYLATVYYSLRYSLENFFQNQEFSLFVFGAVVNYHVAGIAEDVSSPYAFASWLVYYLVIGSLFIKQADKKM